MPKLEPLFNLRAELGDASDVGAVPGGSRRIVGVGGGSFVGPRLRGRVLPSGGDWLLIGADGVGRLDVRLVLETDDGASLYLQYRGVLRFDEKVAKALASGGETAFGDSYFMTTPHFEAGDPRYAWLNSIVCVAQGRVLPGGVEYRVFEVQND